MELIKSAVAQSPKTSRQMKQHPKKTLQAAKSSVSKIGIPHNSKPKQSIDQSKNQPTSKGGVVSSAKNI